MRRVILISAYLFIISYSFCQNVHKGNKLDVKDSVTITCVDYATIETSIGILTNNVWNKHAANEEFWKQCLVMKIESKDTIYGWEWSWPSNIRAIFGYPQVKVGSSPWAPTPNYDDRFPIPLNKLKSMIVNYEVEIETSGDANLATSMWLIDKPNPTSKPNKEIIRAEIMFWTYKTEAHFVPGGHIYSVIDLDGEEWEVWYDKNWEDASGVNKNKWIYITFRLRNNKLNNSFKASELLKYAVKQNLISEKYLIADVELGNEVMNGIGTTWVKSFHVDTKIDSP